MIERRKISDILLSIIIFVISTAAPAAVVFAAKGFDIAASVYDVVHAALIGGICALLMIFALLYMDIKGHRMFKESGRNTKFTVLYIIFVMLTCALSIISPLVVPTVFFSVILMYYSGLEPAIVSVPVLVCEMCAVSEMSFEAVIFAVISGIFAVIIFSYPVKPLMYVKKAVIAAVVSIAAYSALVVSSDNEIRAGDIIDPSVGIAVSFILLLIFVRRYSKKYLETYDDLYEKINDPEYALLASLKERNKEEYMIAIHTAQLCDRIAKKMGCDRVLCKCLGFYHRIGVINGSKAHRDTVVLAQDNGFPEPAIKALAEYNDAKKKAPESSETIICLLANDIVTSIRYLGSEGGKDKIDYDKIVDYLIDKKINEGVMRNSSLTFSDIEKIRLYFREEHLYYDFLR